MKKTVLALLMMSASVGAMAQSDIALEQKKSRQRYGTTAICARRRCCLYYD